jgi:cellulose synthase/poly-beta-1,6-N-acetylglucosamine synthase-like glycosyltransferase
VPDDAPTRENTGSGMRPVFVIPARNKEKHVGQAVISALNQTLPLEIIISDQGSEDNTLKVIKETVNGYSGPHKVTILECPETQYKGMAGLNAHFNWLHENIEADVFIISSADDFSHPERAEKTMREFETRDVDLVLTAQIFYDPVEDTTLITAHPRENGYVSLEDCTRRLAAGSSSFAWKQSFFRAVGPIPHITILDVYMGPLAAVRNGIYFLAEPLHTYVKHHDENNTGLEGQMRAANGDEFARLNELASYQVAASYLEVAKKLQQWKKEEFATTVDHMMSQCTDWIEARTLLNMKRLTPMSLKV